MGLLSNHVTVLEQGLERLLYMMALVHLHNIVALSCFSPSSVDPGILQGVCLQCVLGLLVAMLQNRK